MDTSFIENIEHIREYFDSVVDFARRTNQLDSLSTCLNRLSSKYFGRETRVCLYKDFAPYSFQFTKAVRAENGTWRFAYGGGIIYHGPHDNGGDGGAPTFSVCLEATHGWSIHT